MDNITQCGKILRHLREVGPITQREAFCMGIYRLASRICDLRERGHIIRTTMLEVTNADGSTSRVARYNLLE